MNQENNENYFKFEENNIGYTITSYHRRGDASITTIEIPAVYNEKPVTEIGNCGFLEATFLKSVFIPESITQIGFEAFSCCESLETIILPSGLTVILDECFSSCKSLQSIEIPEGVTEIGEYAFNSCYMLERVTLPQSLKVIGQRVFSSDRNLLEIKLPDNLEELERDVFANRFAYTIKEKLTPRTIWVICIYYFNHNFLCIVSNALGRQPLFPRSFAIKPALLPPILPIKIFRVVFMQ